jgi:hypothetical protein
MSEVITRKEWNRESPRHFWGNEVQKRGEARGHEIRQGRRIEVEAHHDLLVNVFNVG